MGKAKDQMVKRLGELIEEGQRLAGSRYDAPEIDLWEQQCKDVLREVRDRDEEEFNTPSGADFYMTPDEEDIQDQWAKALPLRVNVLRIVKERLERFEDKPNMTIREIKTALELQLGAGPLKGKISRETTRRPR
jgi:hypothetical protein